MKYKINVCSIMEYGQRKDAQGNAHQEDCMFPAHRQAKDTDRLFIVCDGMGGHDAGEVASATVCEAMSESIMRNAPDPEGNFSDATLQTAINDAFEALDKKDTGAAKKMGTTMTLLKLHSRGATIAHMGDSRVYHIRPGEDEKSTHILFVTEDHSLVNDLVKIGELTPEEAKTSRQKNVITRAMQPNMERRPRADIYHTADIKPGDYFFLCTDGMLEETSDENLRYFFSKEAGSDEEKVAKLTQTTQNNRDNHSAIIVHVLDVTKEPIDGDKEAVDGETFAEESPKAILPPAFTKDDSAPAIQQIKKNEDKTSQKKENKLSKLLNKWLFIMTAAVVIAFAALYFVNANKTSTDNNKITVTLEPQTNGANSHNDSNNDSNIVQGATVVVSPTIPISNQQSQTNQNRESNNAEKQEIENAEPQQESSTNTQTASVINDAVSSMNESQTNNVVVSNENADTSQTRSDSIPPQN